MQTPKTALLLQTLWRSGGTWLWAGFRELPSCRAYCEPLHECLAGSTAEQLEAAFVGSTDKLRHPHIGAHYFAEFPLAPGGGVALFPRVSPLQRFVQEVDDDDLETSLYLERLVGHAIARGQLPVFKLCRMALRAAWLRRVMPAAACLYLTRNPDDLHRSYWSQGAATNYFSVQYAAVLLIHGHHIRWRHAVTHLLGDSVVEWPSRCGAEQALEHAFLLCKDRGPQFSRDLSLLFWTHALLDSVRAGNHLVDYDLLVDDPRSLERLLEFCASRIGAVPVLGPPRRTPQPEPGGLVIDSSFARSLAADLGSSGIQELRAAAVALSPRSVEVVETLAALAQG